MGGPDHARRLCCSRFLLPLCCSAKGRAEPPGKTYFGVRWFGGLPRNARTGRPDFVQLAQRTCDQRKSLVSNSTVHWRVSKRASNPRWLLPEPPLPSNGRLQPQARPQIIKQRCSLFQQGHWDRLYTHMTPSHVNSHVPEDEVAPELITLKEAKAVIAAARTGKLTAAWRRLHTFGLLPPSDTTCRLVREKWDPSSEATPPADVTSMTTAESTRLVTPSSLRKASRSLRAGSASDALGWFHETIHQLLKDDRLVKVLVAVLQSYFSDTLGHRQMLLLNGSAIIPLAKSRARDAARPIAIPTAFRKLAATICLQHWRPLIAESVGDAQHGAPQRDGSLRFASSLQSHLQHAPPGCVFIRTDVMNAFGTIDRQAVLSRAKALDPRLCQALVPWLGKSSLGALRSQTTTKYVLATGSGIPQGNPLSAVTYCITTAPLLKLFAEPRPIAEAHAFADDTVIMTTEPEAGTALLRFQGAMADIGLKLNPSKTLVWGPSLSSLPASLSTILPQSSWSPDGLVICGLPVAGPILQHDTPCWPVGTPDFVSRFLTACADRCKAKLTRLACIAEQQGPNTIALHVILRLLRYNVESCWTHLWRFLAPAAARPLAQTLDHVILEFVRVQLCIPVHNALTQDLLRAPVAEGGLNIVHQTTEAALHCLSGAFALQVMAQQQTSVNMLDPAHVAEYLAQLTPLLPQDPVTIIEAGDLRSASRRIRIAVYRLIGQRIRADCPWLVPPSSDIHAPIPNLDASQLRWAMSWWSATSDNYLPAAPLRLALQRHVGLQCFHSNQTCGYAPLTTGQRCCTPLGHFSAHINSCAQGPRLHRHHALVQKWRELLNAAGYFTQLEQEVLLPDSTTRRADLLARHNDGSTLALDVLVTGSPDLSQSIDAHLSHQAHQKASRYQVPAGGLLPGGIKFIPIAHASGVPFLHGAALDLFVTATRAAAILQAPEDDTAWGAHLSRVTHEHAAKLTSTMAAADWGMHAACGRLC